MDDAEQRRKIRNFTFDECKGGSKGFERILLQLFGYLGHGKSSFINSIIYVWSNSQYKNCASAGVQDGSRTKERLSYTLTKNITLVDNKGCSKMNDYETGEIFAQLGNLLPLDKPVSWSTGFKLADRIVEAEPHVKASDFIIPIIVYSVRKSITPDSKRELKAIFKTATDLTTVVPMVVLTHKNYQNFSETKDIFRDIGAEMIFGLENYTDNIQRRKTETDKEIIRFLHEVIRYAEFRANYPRDADQEMIDRKLFVLKYIHERELRLQKANLDKQKEVEKLGMDQVLRLRQEEEEKRRQKSEELHKETMDKLQRDFNRQMLQEQLKHEERMRQLDKRKGKHNKKNQTGK